MTEISRLIRYDGEFLGYLNCLFENMAARSPLPIAINGLTSAAQRAFLCESVREAYERVKAPVLLLAGNEEEARQLTDLLSLDGIRAGRFPARDFVFHNVGASHDVERERLSVLSDLRRGVLVAHNGELVLNQRMVQNMYICHSDAPLFLFFFQPFTFGLR